MTNERINKIYYKYIIFIYYFNIITRVNEIERFLKNKKIKLKYPQSR